jgi:hypothetical protein
MLLRMWIVDSRIDRHMLRPCLYSPATSHETGLTRFRQTSDGDVIPGPEQRFDIVRGYFSADLKSFFSHSLNMHFPITRSSMAFLKIKVMLLS